MKFAHTFTAELEQSNFPPEWTTAAIRYRELKKCIKRVSAELHNLGLDAETLQRLIASQGVGIDQQHEAGTDGSGDEDEMKAGPRLRYMFDGTLKDVQPKLVLTMERKSGIPLDLGLSEETRRVLEKLIERERGSRFEELVEDDEGAVSEKDQIRELVKESSDSEDDVPAADHVAIPEVHDDDPAALHDRAPLDIIEKEIVLTADVEFFQLLTSELYALSKLQSSAVIRIESTINSLGTSIVNVSSPVSHHHPDLYPWREIFRIYLDSAVFFSTRESESGARTPEKAKDRIAWFTHEVHRLGLEKQFRQKESKTLLKMFLKTNLDVLQLLKFQDMNVTAMKKILKKFDKRTSLGARLSFPAVVASNPFLVPQLAKALCYTMSSQLVNTIPQLDDYLCPICSSLAVKPVRLSCSHIFCVRCLVKLQRERKRFCPLCRGDVVLQADSFNLDTGLLNFLVTYFPKEAREKQRENEKEVVLEQWRNVHRISGAHQDCVLM